MRPIICDGCQMRIDKDWTGPALEVKTHNGVDSDVSGDYCTDCAGDIADAIRAYRERRDALLETHTTLEEAIANAN